MREVIFVRVNDKQLIVDPVVDALFDIAKGKLHKCMYGTGIGGYVTRTLDAGDTSLLPDKPIKVASGSAHCTQFPTDPDYTSNDHEYMLQYNQTILHHLDSSRASTAPYTTEELAKGKPPYIRNISKIDINKDEVPF